MCGCRGCAVPVAGSRLLCRGVHGRDGAGGCRADTVASMVEVDGEARDVRQGALQENAKRQVVPLRLGCAAPRVRPKLQLLQQKLSRSTRSCSHLQLSHGWTLNDDDGRATTALALRV